MSSSGYVLRIEVINIIMWLSADNRLKALGLTMLESEKESHVT